MTYDEPANLLETIQPVFPDISNLLTFDSRNYQNEEQSLTQQLLPLGITIERWFNYDSDSFGPLMRGCRLTSTNPAVPSGYYSYG